MYKLRKLTHPFEIQITTQKIPLILILLHLIHFTFTNFTTFVLTEAVNSKFRVQFFLSKSTFLPCSSFALILFLMRELRKPKRERKENPQ